MRRAGPGLAWRLAVRPRQRRARARRNRPVAFVERVRALVAARFGPCSSPLEFVARAKVLERDARATVAKDPPRPTTDW